MMTQSIIEVEKRGMFLPSLSGKGSSLVGWYPEAECLRILREDHLPVSDDIPGKNEFKPFAIHNFSSGVQNLHLLSPVSTRAKRLAFLRQDKARW